MAARRPWLRLWAAWAGWLAVVWTGCAVTPPQLTIDGLSESFPAGTIVDTARGQVVSFEQMMADLKAVRVVYVGETHTDTQHHRIQQQVLEALWAQDSDLAVGMEMFDRSYQPVLERWSRGELEQDAFVQATHWYANWRFDYGLYRDLLAVIREKRIRLVGLNVPFHLPSKVSTGGLDSLRPNERRQLANEIDLNDAGHRRYLENIFNMHHHRLPGRSDFERFYAAQCVREDTMAEAVAHHLGQGRMLVIAGNGHIVEKFGIPVRAHRRTGAPYRTVYLAAAGSKVSLQAGDYIMVTPKKAP